tara:strand:+ start:140 stop:1516 length:1377 start_codon:yes stop_codon:yes gene_type:complete
MKGTSTSIQNWINNQSIQEQMGNLFVNNVGYSAHETTIEEIKVEYDFILEQLNYFIEKDELDKLTFHKRTAINTMFNNITSQLKQSARYNFIIKNNPGIGINIFSYILSLRDLIDPILYFTKGKGTLDYINESKELIKIKKRYLKLVSDIELVEKDKEKVIKLNSKLTNIINANKDIIKNLEQNSTTVKNLNYQIQKLYNQIQSNAEDIASKKITINSLHKTAKELENIFENANSEVKELSQISSDKIKTFIDDSTTFVEEKIELFTKKTNTIVSKNEGLQYKINSLLEGANAGELYKAFNTRKKDIEETLNKWLGGIILINVFLVLFTLLIINGSEYMGIKALNTEQMDTAFYLKLFISIPLLFLDWFIIRQYNQRNDLAEKYAFKSVLSLSLLAYNEMMLDNKENKISLEFISSTVEKIYQSPFDSKDLTKVELGVLNKLAEKGLEKIETVKKIIE